MEVVSEHEEPVTRLEFEHVTTYRYSGPVSFGKHRFVLRPRESHYEQLDKMSLETSPASDLHWFHDIYGNVIASATFRELADMLEIRSRFVMTKKPEPAWVEENWLSGERYPVHYPGIEETASYLYRQSVYPPEVEEIRSWLFSLSVLPPPGNTGPIFARLAEKIHSTISYQRREAAGVQSPLETLRLGNGSCRDTAVLMMEAGRTLGFATRFVSGYMESENSIVGRGSTHAWCEVYLPDRGWRGFDPSIGKPVGIGHVAVAVSHHPRGVMPITGRFDNRGFSAKGLTVAIHSRRLKE